jgi:hypothetical protein
VRVDAVNRRGDPPGDRHAARANADQRQRVEVGRAGVALQNLVRDARERLAHAAGIHHDRQGDTCL